MLDKPRLPEAFPAPDYAPERWKSIRRDYTIAEVRRLAGSLPIRHSLAEHGARRLWELLHSEAFVPTLGTFTGNQAVQQVKAGLKAIYLSGWQVAADANSSGNMYPDQSLYPVDSVPAVVKRINKALQRADQIQTMEKADGIATTDLDFFVPIIADAEAGFGGALNVFELMKAMIEAGAAAVHFEDQLASEKKCGHLGGKVLVPTSQFVRTLNAARLAADVMGVPTLIWCETSKPDLTEARRFAEAVRKVHPEQMLAYNCSPSFNWAKHMDPAAMKRFQAELGAMGYKYQFITLAGFHNLSLTTFELARAYAEDGMAAYSRLQQAEFAAEKQGFSATRHQREVGTSYFDAVAMTVSGGESATTAMAGSTETNQFH
jgi:isocitrate lyase